MAEIPKGCGTLYRSGPVRDRIARSISFIEGDGLAQPLINRETYNNFDRIVMAASDLSLQDETAAYLDDRFASQELGRDWRDIVPVAAAAVLSHPHIVTTTTEVLKKIIPGRSTAKGGEIGLNFKNILLNRRMQGALTGIVLNAHGKLANPNPRLTPAQEGACVVAMINAGDALFQRLSAGTVHELYNRDEFAEAMNWIKPNRSQLVYRRT